MEQLPQQSTLLSSLESAQIPDDDRRLIQRAYRQLLRSIKSDLTEEDKRNIRQAYEIAVDAHSKQRRKSGEPYILHPIEVARICAEEIGLGPTAIVAALLHDTVEDTDVTLEDIKAKFGERISRIVDGLTKLDHSVSSESPQAENFKKVLSTLVEDVRVVLIKMADRLHNMRTISSMPRHKQLQIAAETDFIYAPLAHRLGLYAIKTEYQDLCLKVTEPDAYFEIARKLQETKRERNKYINEFIRPLIKHLDELKAPYRIFGRPKSIHSIWNKIKNKQVTFEEVYDLFAIRIVFDVPYGKEKSICWQAYSIVTDVHKPIPERLKDWLNNSKSNGYESLHTTVIGPGGRFVEVQIRTERMDEIAEKGYAAHYKYKGVTNKPDVYDNWLDNIRDLLENPNADALEFISDFKSNLFNEEVYVFTPVGDMVMLPKGATALDFAFNIHSEVGYHCTSVKVNNKLVPMGYELKNGDQVQVLTGKNQKPSEGWLKLVITGKAKSKIRSALREEYKRHGQIGKEALERKLKNMGADFDQGVDLITRHFGFSSYLDLYYAIAIENFKISDSLRGFTVEGGKLVEPPSQTTADHENNRPAPGVQQIRRYPAQTRLLIAGEPGEHYSYSFASCCNPLPGDDIFAYLTINAGLKIHRSNCPNATNLRAQYGYRILKAEWAVANSAFVADLRITGVDSGKGIIERITHEVSSKLGLNIKGLNIQGDQGYFEGRLSLEVQNADQLYHVIQVLQNLDHVSTVTRVE